MNWRVMVSAVAAAGLASLLTACSSASAAPPPGKPGSSCGATRTAANVPVIIKVVKGTVNCGTALSIENGYATMIKAGKVRGNGGGAPVQVNGWMCQGYPAPKAALTGNASECHTGSAEVVAEWALPSAGN